MVWMKTWSGSAREELIDEVKKLRQGIRRHRDSSRHELCWHHPALWGLLPEKTDPIRRSCRSGRSSYRGLRAVSPVAG